MKAMFIGALILGGIFGFFWGLDTLDLGLGGRFIRTMPYWPIIGFTCWLCYGLGRVYQSVNKKKR